MKFFFPFGFIICGLCVFGLIAESGAQTIPIEPSGLNPSIKLPDNSGKKQEPQKKDKPIEELFDEIFKGSSDVPPEEYENETLEEAVQEMIRAAFLRLTYDPSEENRQKYEEQGTVTIRHRYEYSEEFSLTENNLQAFFKKKNITIPKGGPKGYSWEQTVRNEQGKPILVAYTDNSGRLCRGPHVWSAMATTYSVTGQLMGIDYFDIKGKPMLVEGDYASMRFVYDDKRRVRSIRFLNKEGKSAKNSLGYAQEILQYQEPHGFVYKKLYFDEDNKPVNNKYGYHCARYTYEESKLQQVINEELVQDQKLKDLQVGMVPSYQILEIFYEDIYSKPVKHKLGYEGITYKYNEKGLLEEGAYCRKTGGSLVPMDTPWGFSRIRYEYDKEDRIEKVRYHTKDSAKEEVCCGGFSRQEFEYNDEGFLVSERYFAKENLVNGPLGWALVEYEYKRINGQLRLTQELYKDEKERLVMIPAGYAYKVWVYDDEALLESESYWCDSDYLTFGPEGYSLKTYTYEEVNHYKRLCRTDYFDIRKLPMRHRGGYDRIHYEYDEEGRQTKKIYCDIHDEIGTTPWTYTEILENYNNGTLIERLYASDESNTFGEEDAYCYSLKRDYYASIFYFEPRISPYPYSRCIGAGNYCEGRYLIPPAKEEPRERHYIYIDLIGRKGFNQEGIHRRSTFLRSKEDEEYDISVIFYDRDDGSIKESILKGVGEPAMNVQLYHDRRILLNKDGSLESEIFYDKKKKEVPAKSLFFSGYRPAKDAQGTLDDVLRRHYFSVPDKKESELANYRRYKEYAHYELDAYEVPLVKELTPITLSHIPKGIADQEVKKEYNDKGELIRAKYSYPTQWNCTKIDFDYNAEGFLATKVLSTPLPDRGVRFEEVVKRRKTNLDDVREKAKEKVREVKENVRDRAGKVKPTLKPVTVEKNG